MKRIVRALLCKVAKLDSDIVFLVFDRTKPPVSGDTITIGNLKATFKKK